jgi:hypothetical protein
LDFIPLNSPPHHARCVAVGFGVVLGTGPVADFSYLIDRDSMVVMSNTVLWKIVILFYPIPENEEGVKGFEKKC